MSKRTLFFLILLNVALLAQFAKSEASPNHAELPQKHTSGIKLEKLIRRVKNETENVEKRVNSHKHSDTPSSELQSESTVGTSNLLSVNRPQTTRQRVLLPLIKQHGSDLHHPSTNIRHTRDESNSEQNESVAENEIEDEDYEEDYSPIKNIVAENPSLDVGKLHSNKLAHLCK